MGFRYQLRDESGDDLGEGEYSFQPGAGDTIHVGAARMLVTAVVPIERVQEHVARPLYGLLEVAPVDET